MGQEKHILIICGEASGDLNASDLARELMALEPGIRISGIGGPLLRQTGAKLYADIKGLAVMGLFDVLMKLPQFLALKKLIMKKIREERPDAVVLVDFSGFNLRLAKAAYKNVPIIYYISPQVWASREGRVKTIQTCISKMIVIFKFEEAFYKKHGINADFVGHPLLDIVKPLVTKKEFLHQFHLSGSKTTIALLPGSRKTEIKKILPVMIKTARAIKKRIENSQFIIAKSPHVESHIYERIITDAGIKVTVIEGKTYDCLNSADFALVCSGTATLEAAIIQKPFAVVYKTTLLNYLLYRPQIKLPHISLVNILAQKEVVPEYIQFRATPHRIATMVIDTLHNPAALERMKEELENVTSLLGDKGASKRAARIILDFMKPLPAKAAPLPEA
ncbi:MAG: lipid-A-disaccharide synthase [Candidatus Omnitrophota bacterium]|jgi:lipid-A-disaccharide synthase